MVRKKKIAYETFNATGEIFPYCTAIEVESYINHVPRKLCKSQKRRRATIYILESVM